MSKELKKTIKYSFIYGIGVVFSKIVSIIMLPIYTRYLTPEDYGILELLNNTVDVTLVVLSLGILQAIFRFYYKYDDEKEKKEVISTVFLILLPMGILGISLLILLAPKIAIALFDSSYYEYHVKIIAITILFQATVSVPMSYIQALQNPVKYVIVNFISLFLMLSLNIIFVVFLEMKVLGILYSTLIAKGIISIYLVYYLLKEVGISYSHEKAKEILKFGYPLIISGFASFYLQYSDRYFIKVYSDLTQVGLYGISYKLGFIFTMFLFEPFFKIWDVQQFEIYKKKNAREIFQRTFSAISFILISGFLVMSVFSRDFFRIVAAPEYESAYIIVPIILLAFLFRPWSGLVNLGILIEEKTIYTAIGTYLSAIIITIFCVLLIPDLGGLGAAIATLIAFIVRFFWTKTISYRYYNMNLKWKKTLSLLFISIIIIAISYTIKFDTIINSLLFNFSLIVIFIGFAFIFKIVPQRVRLFFINTLKNPIMFKNNYKILFGEL